MISSFSTHPASQELVYPRPDFQQCAKSKFNRESTNLKDLNGTLDASPHVNDLRCVAWVYNVQIGDFLVHLIFTDIVATVSQYVLNSAVFIGSGVSEI